MLTTAMALCCRCFNGSLGTQASDTCHLYLWAGDDLPTHNSVQSQCADGADSRNGPSTCSAAQVSCAQPPITDGDGQQEGDAINWQEEPFFVVTINKTLAEDLASPGGRLPHALPLICCCFPGR